MDDVRHGVGGNNPPATLADELAIEFKEDLAEADKLLASADKSPDKIPDGDDETQSKFTELIKKLRASEIAFEKAYATKRKPLADKIAEFGGFFNTHAEKWAKARLALKKVSDAYLTRKADLEKERLRKEEEERRAQAERMLKLARDAEETKNAAASQAAEARKLAEEANEARSAAQSEQEQASADLALARADHATVKADMLQVNAGFALRAKNGDPATDEEKAAKRTEFEGKLAAAKKKIEEAENTLKGARQRAADAKKERDRQEQEAQKKEKEARTANREAGSALESAVKETKVADKIAAKVEGPEAEHARTRSLHGGLATLGRHWKCEIIDREKIDMEALRPHINLEALNAALWKWVQAQTDDKRVMPGTIIERVVEGQYR